MHRPRILRCRRLARLAGLLAAVGPWLHAAEAPPDTARRGWLRGTVLDDATGQPTACSVEIVDALGQRVTETPSFDLGFRSAGAFTKNLPEGPTRIRVWRGFETRAEERVVDVRAGVECEVAFRLRRNVDLRARGWYAGDSHAHMLHGERTVPVSFDTVALAARAEDLHFLSLAQAWAVDEATPERLESELGARSLPECVLTWNLEAPKNYYRGDATRCLGHCWTLGLRGRTGAGDDAIQWLLSASAHDYESEKPRFANFESHRFIRAQGGRVFYTHPARWWTGPWGGRGGYPRQEQARISNLAVELPLDVVLGPTFDGLDVMTTGGEAHANRMAFALWCLLLNHGYRLAATASSDACFDRPGGATPGVVRTYTHLPDGFTWAGVAEATAAGRTFASSGPLLLVTLDGKPPGTSLLSRGSTHRLNVEAWASGADPRGLTSWQLLRNGALWLTNQLSPPVATLRTNLELRDSSPAWYCVRVFGGDPSRQQAVSGAFFLDAVPHQPPPPVPARVLAQLVDRHTGNPVAGRLREVAFEGPRPTEGAVHAAPDGQARLQIPGWVRLRAEAPGYQSLTLSPFLDDPVLRDYVTGLRAEDLLEWATYERVRTLLGNIRLDFGLEPAP